MRPYLEDPCTTDECLFEKVNIADSHEGERREKLSHQRTATAKINELSVPEETANVKRKPREGTLMTDLAELKAGIAEISALKQQLTSLQQTMKPNTASHQQSNRRTYDTQVRRRGCNYCQQQGSGDNCNHCFICGSSEHFARGCRQRRRNNQSGNDQGLLPRDGQ